MTVAHFVPADGVQREGVAKRNKLRNQKHPWYQASDSHFPCLGSDYYKKINVCKWLVTSPFIIRAG